MAAYGVLSAIAVVSELAWGCWASNLSFVSDAMHMCFDIFSICICMRSMMKSRNNGSRSFAFSYGYAVPLTTLV